jgi:hypothetical protein
MRKKLLGLSVGVMLLMSGCAKVPMAPKEDSDEAKLFSKPSQGEAGLYVYRGSGLGTALKKSIYVNSKCLGTSAPNVFFYKPIKGDEEHELATQSEFSPNKLKLKTQSGKNYFVRQYIKMGVFVGGANLEVVDEEQGKKAIQELEMATGGKCNPQNL